MEAHGGHLHNVGYLHHTSSWAEEDHFPFNLPSPLPVLLPINFLSPPPITLPLPESVKQLIVKVD
jgi:hypothetical protein